MVKAYKISKIEKALEQFNCQIVGIAAGINLWWQMVEQSLLWEEVDAVIQNWLVSYLLPEVYWLSQLSKTKNPSLKAAYQKTSEQIHQQLLAHELTLTLNKV